MDKIKPYLRVAIKHHFWILCGLIAILTLGSWYTTSASLTSQFQTNKGKIKSAEDTLQAIASRQNHPNPNYHQQMDLMINAYKDNLRVLWENQYLNQGHNLKWPVQTATEAGLTKDFVEQVEPLRPIETTVPYDPTNKGLDKLKDNFKAEYINYVKSTALPSLAKTIGATWSPSDSAQGTGGGSFGGSRGGERGGIEGTTTEDVPQDIVFWNPGNQSDLQEKRFDWRKEVGGRPSTLQILYAQEDLWVLETLIKIIAKTNADADAPHNAVVKNIEYLKIGADAVGLSGGVMRLTAAGAPGTEGAPLATGAPPVAVPMEGGPGGQLGVPGTGPVDPALGRYVDSNYKPVEPDRLRLAFTSTNADDAFLAVAKRMPVRMHLTVDQRKLHRLLAECGNSNLVVEIRQMRINRPVYAGGPGGSSAAVPGGGFGGERGGFGGPSSQPSSGGGESQLGANELKPVHDIEVELYGIVYIYNPVNEAMVAAVASGDGSPVEAPAAPAAPAPMGVTPAPAVPAAPAPGGVVPAAPMPAEPMPAVPAPMPAVPAPMPAVPAPAVPAPGGAAAPMPAAPPAPMN